MDRKAIQKQLTENGFCVVPNVVPEENCNEYLQTFQKWYASFKEDGQRMRTWKSIIKTHRIGHFEAAWKCRLHSKPVFEKIWGTDKLLTSVDAVALTPPAEKDGQFREPGGCWLHLDQSVKRLGNHAYQGAVYVEETTKQDYCFRVLKNSHAHHSAFFKKFPKAADKTRQFEFFKLNKTQRKWYEDQGCPLTYVPVPKGGMVLWDSRTVHDTDPPEVGRPKADKWRCVVFVSMTPAFWADESCHEFKQGVYEKMQLTTHWSSQGQKAFVNYKPKKRKSDGAFIDEQSIEELPPVAKTMQVKLLMGVEKYNFDDGKPNGPPAPTWIP